jgi:Na+-translocating ferredoxin:NAD+ oxidoreductase subunit B
MNDVGAIYRNLQKHLDAQTVGYPATKSGAEIRILKRLFAPVEAHVALYLTYKPTVVEEVYQHAKVTGMSFGDLTSTLNRMAGNGAIGHVEREGRAYFYVIPFVVGMFEHQLNKLTPEFLRDTDQFFSHKAFGLSLLSTKVPQMRTIPVGKSISVDHHVMTFDSVVDVIQESTGPFSVMECICRKSAGIRENPCKKTSRLETCMPLGQMAKHAIETGTARQISRQEALEIVRMNEGEGLVFQPSNTQKIDFLCSCCGCCCGMLHIQKMLPRPVDFWATNFQVSLRTESCSSCGTCVERCQVGALRIDDRTAAPVVNLDRCIGCGNCVVTCPNEAMSLQKREKVTIPPRDQEDLYTIIMANKKGLLGKAALVAKLVLKI